MFHLYSLSNSYRLHAEETDDSNKHFWDENQKVGEVLTRDEVLQYALANCYKSVCFCLNNFETVVLEH